MTTIDREIHVDAPPDLVRRHLADPDRRRSWLGEDVDAATEADGSIRFGEQDETGTSHVHIDVLPDGEGSRVRVTVDLEPATVHDLGAADEPPPQQPEARVPLLLAA